MPKAAVEHEGLKCMRVNGRLIGRMGSVRQLRRDSA